MAVPDFQSIMLPLLRASADGQEHALREVRESLAAEFGMTDEDRAEMLPSGRQRTFDNRVAWAKSYLQQAGLLESPRRGHHVITQRGRDVLAENPPHINIRFLERFPEFVEFRSPNTRSAADTRPDVGPSDASGGATPEEGLEESYLALRSELARELLAKVLEGSALAFERLVVELLLKMGYGGSRREAGEAIGRSGDEGIDGIIREDRLGLDVIYLQAKRWNGTVGRPEIQKFVGALHGKRARKGVFITTGAFSADAEDYVARIDPKVVLIGGRRLAELMIDYELGVTTQATFEVKRLDSDYFAEE